MIYTISKNPKIGNKVCINPKTNSNLMKYNQIKYIIIIVYISKEFTSLVLSYRLYKVKLII